ncbi:MAG TPA: C25 family cysteine peptidase, partial [Ignavibacteriaceae bacterium]|nr:C25 family cysteine peptidase [Ignavibacteriaceae bacterium]
SPLDTIVFSYKQTVNFFGDYNSNQLVAGNNTVRIFGMQNDSQRWHQALIDWIDVEYQRYNVASNDSLLIRVDENTSTAERVVKVSNVTQQSANMIVYKIKPSFKKITSFSISNSVLTFTDTVAANDEYIVIKQSLAEAPIFQKKKFFVNLRDSNRGADYIAITNRVLQSSAEEYINFINNNYETRNELIYVDDIYDEFSFGYAKPEAIKDFLYYANQNWIAPSPSYLLLLGDANYDYKNKITPPPNVLRKNLVPSYGNPVSDVWFTMWDSSNVNLPQMFVGRIPATLNEEVNFYLNKHQTYLNRRYDDFNKRYLFFSGGDANNPSQLELLKSANSYVLNNVVRPLPVGGEGIHFYKTIDPPSNFGPYTREQVDNAIDSSGLFISYIGHSGTETWDNGITEVSDLKPAFNDRLSLISDFGCSTGKFAEPNVSAFGELFICGSLDGQAIGYLGNSSFGYVSSSVNYPKLFYQNLLLDSLPVISRVHYMAKLQLINQFGTSDVNRAFNYCNIFFGDPILEFKLPPKPNFRIDNGSFTLIDNFPLDTEDSIQIKLELINFGKVLEDSVSITIKDIYNGNEIFFSEWNIPIPLYKKEIYLSIPISGLVGEHNLEVIIDKNNFFDEIYEDDNSAYYNFIVYSSSIRPIESEKFYNSLIDQLEFLNPVFLADTNVSSIVVAIADNPEFLNSVEESKSMNLLKTRYDLPVLGSARYWLRAKLNLPEASWSNPFSFFNAYTFSWYFNRSFNYSDLNYNNVAFDSANGNWKLTKYENLLEIGSAGFDDGGFGSIKLNDTELLPNTLYWGIATAIIDSLTLVPSDIKYFVYSEVLKSDSLLIAYIDSIPTGTFLAMTVCVDAAQSVLGFSQGTPVRQAIETLGSLYVDSVLYRDSWCMIGKKGAVQGTVLESFKKQYSGPAMIETSVIVSNKNGWIEFPQITNSSEWLTLTKTDSLTSGGDIIYIPIGIKSDNTNDTLAALTFSGDVADISNINAIEYPSIRVLTRINANENFESPVFKEIGVNFIPVPELATNYQVVSSSADSVTIGEDIGLSFYVYNVGESKADSFDVKVEVINEDNSRQTIFTQQVDSLKPDDRKLFEVLYNTSSGSGAKTFLINIDSDNHIRELFEDNNFFSVPFFIKPDTTKPVITLTIDGNDILDGEYVASNPTIHIELNDESLLPITDPSSVMVYLNDELIPVDTSIINYQFSETNPKVTVDFTPVLTDGEYAMKILWKDSGGNIVDSSGVEKFFLVSNEAKLLNVYNYPNPSKGETHFTFKLTQIPEEIRIKIFTIAGRLVREIKLSSSELKYDFNKIFWDGRDEDGDVLANGVYLYKVIMKAGNRSEEATQKLAIVK